MHHPVRPELERLAELHGIEPRYRAQDGREVHASDEALLRTLRAAGAPLDSLPQVPEALRESLARRNDRRLPRVWVLWEADAAEIPLRFGSQGLPSGRMVCRMEREDGRSLEWTVTADQIGRRGTADGSPAPHCLPLPEPIPRGVHQLTVTGPEAGRTAEEAWVIRAPRGVFEGDGGRSWGFFLPLHALRSADDWGTGSLSDLDRLRRWGAARGARWIGTLPLLASYLDRPFEPSPYSPASRLFWNELYTDPRRAPEPEWSDGARALVDSEDFRRECAAARASPIVDYRYAYSLKRRVLEELARSAFEHGDRARALVQFARDRPELVGYAAFRAGMERGGQDWWKRTRGGRPDLRALNGPIEPAFRYHLYAQWLFEGQLHSAAGGRSGTPLAELYLDLPLGCHPLGYDTWRWPHLFAEGVAVGAPPDDLAAEGQNWGFPPLQPQASRREAYRYWRSALNTLLRPAGALRVDHVMALHRLFWIPDGMPATEGVYVRYPDVELYALLALESHRHRCRIVGEDLGTVEDEVRKAMGRRGLLGMYVLPFELGREGQPRAVPDRAQASLNTHDTATFAGWVRSLDLNRREAEGLLPPDRAEEERRDRRQTLSGLEEWLEAAGFLDGSAEAGPLGDEEGAAGGGGEPSGARIRRLLDGCLRFLGDSPARILLLNLEDLWLEGRPQNVPGTGSEEGSWRGRARHPLEELDSLPEVGRTAAELRRLRPGSDR